MLKKLFKFLSLLALVLSGLKNSFAMNSYGEILNSNLTNLSHGVETLHPLRDAPDFRYIINKAQMFKNFNKKFEARCVYLTLMFYAHSSEALGEVKRFWEQQNFSFIALMDNVEKSDQIEILPPEMMVLVFKKLELKDGASCALVCHEWRDLKNTAFDAYDKFKEHFVQLKTDFEIDPIYASRVLDELRNSAFLLFKNMPGYSRHKDYKKLLKSLNSNLIGNNNFANLCDPGSAALKKDIILTKHLVNNLYLNIKPVWVNLALFRASDAFLIEGADKAMDGLPIMIFLGYSNFALYIMMATAELVGQQLNFSPVNQYNIYIELLANDYILQERIRTMPEDGFRHFLECEYHARGLSQRQIN